MHYRAQYVMPITTTLQVRSHVAYYVTGSASAACVRGYVGGRILCRGSRFLRSYLRPAPVGSVNRLRTHELHRGVPWLLHPTSCRRPNAAHCGRQDGASRGPLEQLCYDGGSHALPDRGQHRPGGLPHVAISCACWRSTLRSLTGAVGVVTVTGDLSRNPIFQAGERPSISLTAL